MQYCVSSMLDKLQTSSFRRSFHLNEKEIRYIEDKGFETVRRHAYDFLNKRIRIKMSNDGKQTPRYGHPVFIAQHATATCCRGCIEKWYKFSQNAVLSDDEIDYLVDVIMAWIEYQMKK